jgi:hypothetical protein
MEKYSDPAKLTSKKKKNKKHFLPYKKDKYSISKLKEYKNYIDYLDGVRNQGNLELE